MTDVAANTDTPPESAAPVSSEPLPDIFARNLPGKPIAMSENGDELRAELRKRKRDNEGGQITDLHSEPILPLRYTDGKERSLREVSRDTSIYHDRERGKELLGAHADQFSAADQQEVGRLLNPATRPPLKVGVNADGTDIPALNDKRPIMELDTIKNARDATEFMGNWREARAAEAQRVHEDLAREQQAAVERQAEVARLEEAAKEPPQPSREAVAQQEQARLELERHQLAQLHQASVEERNALNERHQIRQWIDTNYPPAVRTPEGFAQLERHNPAHAQYLVEWLPEAISRDQALAEGLSHAGQIRQAQAIQSQHQRQAAVEQWGRQQDELAVAAIKKDMPAFANDEAFARLRGASKKALARMGVSEAEATRLWRDGTIRNVPAQRMIARLAAMELAQDVSAHRAPVPPVQRPGTVRPRDADAASDVARLERALENASSERESLNLAAALTRARRAAGGL
jgi:hypothetical protein